MASNINDFGRFADGGDDANWYIGFNNSWIVKLQPAPIGEFNRSFIGAKIGRAKTKPTASKPWLREVIDGKIYMGISQTPSFTAQQSFFLAETKDMPLEPQPDAQIEGVGAGEWFWAEVPLSMVSVSRPNYLINYSPTDTFLKTSASPVLAAAAVEDSGAREIKAWNNHSITGVPPRNPDGALETPINSISPALAIKLAPPSTSEISVSEFIYQRLGKKCLVRFSAWGENMEEAWVEHSRDGLDWQRATRFQRKQPFDFTMPQDSCAAPGEYLRGAARDVLGTVATSDPFQIPYGNP
ncbi:MAG: hypothetical protein NTY77_14835 [Elusimicrobia bacterium]|nr:hypothetical protein [Elusimicrobiota bacterium]